MAEKLFSINFKTTADVPVPEKLVDQVIGQERGVEIVKKASAQKRNVLLIGSPGTGKSMLAQAMAQLLPIEKLQDVLIYPNPTDSNNPKVRIVEAGKGIKILEEEKKKAAQSSISDLKPPTSALFGVILMFSLSIAISIYLKLFSDTIIAAFIIVGGIFLSILLFASAFATGLKTFKFGNREGEAAPKLLIDNAGKTMAPFVDATGAHAGALLGDIKHDPYQCLPPDTKVILADGSARAIGELVDAEMPDRHIDPRTSVDLKKPFQVFGYDDDRHTFVNTDVMRVYRRDYDGDFFEIKTAGGRSVSCTPEHPLGVPYGVKTTYVQARLVRKGHFLLIDGETGLESDKVVEVRKTPYKGFVYNLTTKMQNFVLENSLLVHNSGGLGTPPHLRVESGLIHKANNGVLYIDEVATLSPKSQQELLTAMQEKRYSITGQSDMSSGAMVRTDPVPCDFLLVASGNVFDMDKMHPALRSRIRGYGYEVYLNEYLEDTQENRDRIPRFVAQEVVKDGKIPHFSRDAVEEIVLQARRRAGRKGKLTLKLRDLGGLVRAAGDLARSQGAKTVLRDHVFRARRLARTLEQQIADKQIELKKEYEVFKTEGSIVGRVNGLAVIGSPDDGGTGGGILLPIEAQVTPALAQQEGKIIATGKLGEIAREAVQNVSAIFKKYKGAGISGSDIHIQFLQTYEGVEGDSASVSVATAVVSAMESIPVLQSVAMTGSLSVKGEVLPVGGVTSKVEAAIDAGAKTVIVPEANKGDVFLDKARANKIKIVPAKDLCDVLRVALQPGKDKDRLVAAIAKIIRK